MTRAAQSPSNKPGKTRRATPTNAELVAKERQALDLRLAGATFDAIAERLGYADRSGAQRAVERAMTSTLQEPADQLRELQAARLDRLLLAIWPTALDGDAKAIAQARGLIDQLCKLLGLNAPTKVDVDATVAVDPGEIEIVQRIRAWRAARDQV